MHFSVFFLGFLKTFWSAKTFFSHHKTPCSFDKSSRVIKSQLLGSLYLFISLQFTWIYVISKKKSEFQILSQKSPLQNIGKISGWRESLWCCRLEFRRWKIKKGLRYIASQIWAVDELFPGDATKSAKKKKNKSPGCIMIT